ncbi:MAG: tyrosine/phenylalanine carboxypeptidase domain-containing protein [Polyangia bacterium]
MASTAPLPLEEADRLLCLAASEALPLHHLDPINSAAEMAKVALDPNYNPIFEYPHQDEALLAAHIEKLQSLDLPGYGVGMFFTQAREYLVKRIGLRLNIGDESHWAQQLYPRAPEHVIQLARRILKQPQQSQRPVERPFRATDQVKLVTARLRQYGLEDWRVEVRPNLSATNTDPTNRLINLRADLQASMEEMKRLVVHEIDTHVLRAANGYSQPYRIFAVGAVPSYLMTEEGLAVINEERMGYIDTARTRVFAARVIAAMAALTSSFRDVYAELRDLGFSHPESFTMTRRVKRGLCHTEAPGGYIKDHAYLWGRVLVEEYVLTGGDLSRLYFGKIALEHVPFVEDLGLLPPRYLPYPYS